MLVWALVRDLGWMGQSFGPKPTNVGASAYVVVGRRLILLVKAFKCLALGLALSPLGGCAAGVGQIFAALLTAEAYSPEMDEALFSHAMLGFALVETFAVLTLGVVIVVVSL